MVARTWIAGMLLAGASFAAAGPPTAPVPLAEYYKMRRVGIQASFSHDESLVAYATDEGGRIDVWVQPVAGGPARQITHTSGFLEAFSFSPARDQLVFATDQGGDELPRLFLTSSRGEAPVALTADDPPGSRADIVDWSRDGRTLLYLSSRRDPAHQDLYEMDVAKRTSRLLWQASGKLAFALASKDHRRFVLVETLSDVDNNLYLVERDRPGARLITPHQGAVLYSLGDFSADGKRLYVLSDEGREFAALQEIDLASGRRAEKLAVNWDVERAEVSPGGRYLLTQVNEDGLPRCSLATADGRSVALASLGLPGAVVPRAFSRSDRLVALEVQGEATPRRLFVADLGTGKARPLLDPLPESLRSRPMPVARSVRIPSFDGREVPAFLFQPEGPGPFPAIIDVHGGPTAQSLRQFAAYRSYFVSKGYAVLVPNVRGSTGYGKSWTALDNLDLGGGPLQDVVAARRWLVKEANVDPGRVVVLGGSYGGYMALAAAAFTPTEFAAHVDYFGPSDLKSLVESFPPYWAAYSTYIYQKFGNPSDPAHAAYQHDRSPLYSADRIVRPLLVVQGDRDARVKKDQSDRIVESLRARGVPVEYLVIEGEGHGFSKTENALRAFDAADRFLDRALWP
jgi:dipeptidyl aminopeptidase/acylaminoacyl peptidase